MTFIIIISLIIIIRTYLPIKCCYLYLDVVITLGKYNIDVIAYA